MKKLLPKILLALTALYLFTAFHNLIRSRDAVPEAQGGALYYLLNVDGMKGLGHSALFLVDGYDSR